MLLQQRSTATTTPAPGSEISPMQVSREYSGRAPVSPRAGPSMTSARGRRRRRAGSTASRRKQGARPRALQNSESGSVPLFRLRPEMRGLVGRLGADDGDANGSDRRFCPFRAYSGSRAHASPETSARVKGGLMTALRRSEARSSTASPVVPALRRRLPFGLVDDCLASQPGGASDGGWHPVPWPRWSEVSTG